MKTQQIAIAIMLVTAILGAPNAEAHASDSQADAVFLEGNFQYGGLSHSAALPNGMPLIGHCQKPSFIFP
jgi:hypothetical protein